MKVEINSETLQLKKQFLSDHFEMLKVLREVKGKIADASVTALSASVWTADTSFRLLG